MRSRPLSFYSKLDFVKVLMELERLWQEGMIENFRYKKTKRANQRFEKRDRNFSK